MQISERSLGLERSVPSPSTPISQLFGHKFGTLTHLFLEPTVKLNHLYLNHHQIFQFGFVMLKFFLKGRCFGP